jgi:tetratricopeptide (TPR) repeat protein
MVPRRFSREEEAIIAYDHDISLNPRDIEAWYRKGSLLLKLGRTQDAALAFERRSARRDLPGVELPLSAI